MQGAGIQGTELVFVLLLVFVVIFALMAQKLKTPYPIVLVIAGLGLSFIPGIPKIPLNPEIVFLVVLPPLLYSAAWLTSWRDFRFNLVSILMLAIGLVGFTAWGVAEAAPWIFHGFDWRLGFVLGAVVATTDAIAATAIAKRLGLPKRLVDVIEGESLVNDATGLVALEFGVAMVVSGQTPSAGAGLYRLAYLAVVGVGIGLVVGVVVQWFEKRVEDGPIEITISILVPYSVYLAAEAAHASGVLAVVACGLYLSRRSSEFFTPTVRMQAWAVWDSLTFILNGLVFVAIGLQLPYVLGEIREYRLRDLVLYGLAFSAILIVMRLAWMYPGALLSSVIRRKILHQNVRLPPARQIFVAGWTGMRGVVALAAAISLPESLTNGQPFPQRSLIIFLTFAVILVTLVLQGLTLPPLIRWLGLSTPSNSEREVELARRRMLLGAIEHLDRARATDGPEHQELHQELGRQYRSRLEKLASHAEQAPGHQEQHVRRVGLMRELIHVERRIALELRDSGEISDEVLRQIEYEMDLTETRLVVSDRLSHDEKQEGASRSAEGATKS